MFRKKDAENTAAFFVAYLMNIEGRCLDKPLYGNDLVAPLRGAETQNRKKDHKEYLKSAFKKFL